MAMPYVGEIRMFAGNFAPTGWVFCDGSLMSISEYEALFMLIGTTYGGDGQNTFAVPDLRGRIPLHMGTGPGLPNFVIGQMNGVEKVALTTAQLPSHRHNMLANIGGLPQPAPIGNVPTADRLGMYISAQSSPVNMQSNILTPSGSGQAHDNMMPFLTVSFIISLFGVYPSQN